MAGPGSWLRKQPRGQAGAVAVETAFVFPALFMLMYCGIVYGYLYFLQQRVNFAAQEALRAAIAVDPSGLSTGDYQAALQTQATTAADNTFISGGAPLPAGFAVTFPAPVSSTGFAVQVTYPVGTIFPQLSLPLVGVFPPMPASLSATGEGRLS